MGCHSSKKKHKHKHTKLKYKRALLFIIKPKMKICLWGYGHGHMTVKAQIQGATPTTKPIPSDFNPHRFMSDRKQPENARLLCLCHLLIRQVLLLVSVVIVGVKVISQHGGDVAVQLLHQLLYLLRLLGFLLFPATAATAVSALAAHTAYFYPSMGPCRSPAGTDSLGLVYVWQRVCVIVNRGGGGGGGSACGSEQL